MRVTKYFVYIDGERIGPYDKDDIIELIEDNTISTDTLMFTRQVGEWQPASAYQEFEEAFDDNFIPPPPQHMLTDNTTSQPTKLANETFDSQPSKASHIATIKKKTNLFGYIINWFSKGDKDREIFWWDIFYRYEVTIGALIGAIIALIIGLIIFPIIGNGTLSLMFSKKANSSLLGALILTIFGTLLSLFLSWLMVLPFYHLFKGEEFSPHRRRRFEIGPSRRSFANVFSIGGIIVLISSILRLCYKCIYIPNSTGSIIACLLFILLIVVAINAISYANWRFDWAIENQGKIYSSHDKYWTSEVNFASERKQWKHLRWYKMMAAIVLIAGPSILGTSFMFTVNQQSKKSGLTTGATINPEAKAKYYPDETVFAETNDNDCIEFFVTSLKGNGANVRKLPDLDAEVLRVYPDGTYFYGVYTDKPHWIRIINNGKVVGYIHEENVSPTYTSGYYKDLDDYPTEPVTNDYDNYDNERPVEAIKDEAIDANKTYDSETFRHKRHFHFSGYMTDDKGDHPIELVFDASNNGLSNIVYKNVSLGGKIHMRCTGFSGDVDFIWSFSLAGKDGPKDFIMNLTREDNDTDCYSGTSSVGSKYLTVTLCLY